MCDDKKNLGRPLFPKEIAENSSNWSFAADLGLLKYLEVFSEGLLNKATTVDNNVNSLLNDLTKASLSLDIAKNKFLSLSNTQFIESRVYEDDETALSNEGKNTKAEPVNNNNEENHKNEMRTAALRGIEVINKYFDKVQVIDSDSEGEDTDVTSFVLRSKDPYIDRPLPYVIGTDEWNKKLHVGLEDSSSDNEDEKISEKFSDTDSETDLPIINRSQARSLSGSGSSEADLSNKLDHPVANSTFNDTKKADDLLGSSEDSVSVQVPTQQNSFAEQLAAKLGDVIRNNVEEPVINKRPIQKSKNYREYDNMFSDEPPPLDDYDDELSPKSKDQGIFSGGDGLFDDLNDDEPFWGTVSVDKQEKVSNPAKKPAPNNLLEEDDENTLFSNKQKNTNTSQNSKFRKDLDEILKQQKKPSIFDDNDEDLLFSNSNKIDKKPSVKPKEERSLFDDDNEDEENDNRGGINKLPAKQQSPAPSKVDDLFGDTENNNTKPKKSDSRFDNEDSINAPIGGVRVISNPNIFSGQNFKNLLKNKSLEKESEKKDEANRIDNLPKEKEQRKHTTNLVATQKENKDLFAGDEDDEDDLFKGGLFSNFASNKTSNTFEKSGGLFDDLNESSDEDQLKTSQDKIVDSNKIEGVNEVFKENQDQFKPEMGSKKNEYHPNRNDDNSKTPRGLFSGNEESDSDDLFSSKQSKIISKDKVFESATMSRNEVTNPEPSPIKIKQNKVPSLFDDDFDTEEDDLFSSNFLSPKRIPAKKPQPALGLPKPNDFCGDNDEDDLFSVKESSKGTGDDIFGRNKLFEATIVKDGEDIDNKNDSSCTADLAQTQPGSCDERNNSQINLVDKALINLSTTSGQNAEEESAASDKLLENVDCFVSTVSHKTEENRTAIADAVPSTETPQIEDKLIDDVKESPSKLAEESVDIEQSNIVNENEFSREVKSELHQNYSQRDIPNASGEDALQFNGNQSIDTKKNAFSSTADRIPAVNIFDPDPPPDLEDWEQIEQNISYDDIYTFDNSEHPDENRSSIFDREPSPVFNESSGIVRDQSARLETDISSFYPYATSSRRFSNDLFNEEQSGDSVLANKNVFHSFEPNIPPPIDENTEDDVSNVEITPSGKLENLYSEASQSKQSKSVTFEDDLINKNKDALVFEELDRTKTEETSLKAKEDEKVNEIEKTKPVVLKKPNLKKKTLQDGVKNSEGVKDNAENSSEDVKSYGEKKVKIYINDEEAKTSKEKVSTPETKSPVESEGAAPGKLKHNLNINVFALLPGAEKPPKKEGYVQKSDTPSRPRRSASLDLKEQDVDGDIGARTPPEAVNSETYGIHNSVEDVEVLKSVTKTRARGPVKRRPSTRRGRDSLRNSCIDFTFVSNTSIEDEHDINEIATDERQSLRDELPARFTLPYDFTATQVDKLVSDRKATHAKKIVGDVFKNNADSLSKDHTSGGCASREGEQQSRVSKLNQSVKIAELEVKNSVQSSIKVEDEHEKENTNEVLKGFPQRGYESNIFGVKDILSDLTKDDRTELNAAKRDEKKNRDLFEKMETVIKPKLEKPSTKRIDFLSDLMSIHDSFESKESQSISVAVDKQSSNLSRKNDLFGDDTDDDDLFFSYGGKKNESSSRSNITSKSSKRDINNSRTGAVFPSEVESEDLFSEKKMSLKSNVSKNSLFDDEEDDDLFGQAHKDSHQGHNVTTPSSRRLKTSNLKKLENVTITGDDPLNALNK